MHGHVWAQALPSERSHSNSNLLKLANSNHGWVEHPKQALSLDAPLKNKLFFKAGPGPLTNKALVLMACLDFPHSIWYPLGLLRNLHHTRAAT
jgi:hypothetical protein